MAEIRIEGLAKLYGGRQAEARELADAGLTKAEILARTGCNVALAGIDMTMQPGEITVIMGLSGSGKSTLLRCLIRLIDPSYGAIRFDGADITRFSLAELRAFRRRTASMVFQNFALLPHKSVLANAAFGLTLKGVPRREAEERAALWLERLGLAGYERALPATLSGGMCQRVGLARAFACDPDVLLMDEAFSALDPLIRAELQDQLLGLQRELGKTVVFVTHDIAEALKLGNRIAVMREGRLEQYAPPAELVAAPATPYVARFVGQGEGAR